MAAVVPCLCWVGKGAAKEVPGKEIRARVLAALHFAACAPHLHFISFHFIIILELHLVIIDYFPGSPVKERHNTYNTDIIIIQ